MSFPSGGAIAIYSESTATPNTSWPPSGEPPPHSTSGVPEVTAAARDARLSPHHPKFLSDGDEEEKSSPSSGDNVNFDDVGVKVTSLIRGNIHISPLINWCTLTQQVWCEWASKFAMTRDARTIPNGVSDDLIWGQRKLAFDQLVYRRFLAAENASAQSPIEGKDRRCTVIVLGHRHAIKQTVLRRAGKAKRTRAYEYFAGDGMSVLSPKETVHMSEGRITDDEPVLYTCILGGASCLLIVMNSFHLARDAFAHALELLIGSLVT
jgi:hypothetical protein